MVIDLTQLKTGESGVVVGLEGGFGFMRRIQSLGIREGKRVTKVSSSFWRGPQTVTVDGMEVAIGFGMAKKVLIEAEG